MIFQFNFTQREKRPYSELFWFTFSRIRTEYGEIPYSVRMRENVDQNNSKYGHFLHNVNNRWYKLICFNVERKKSTLLLAAFLMTIKVYKHWSFGK